MTPTDFTSAWVTRYQRNQDAYAQILTENILDGLTENRMPETVVSLELIQALRIAYAKGVDTAQVRAFADRAVVASERVLQLSLLSSEACRSSHPLNRGTLFRDCSYARILRDGVFLVSELRQATLDFEQWCAGYSKSEWDSQAEANYLSSVRIALVIGDVQRAEQLMLNPARFRWHRVEHALWTSFLRSRIVQTDGEVAVTFRQYFDRVRDPQFVPDVYLETEIVRFELAAIWESYFQRPRPSIDWHRVVRSIATG